MENLPERRPGDLDLHVIAAVIMIAIAVFGAVAAYRVALAEQRTVNLERRLAMGQLLDIGYRQHQLGELLVRIGLTNLQAALEREAADLRTAAPAAAGTPGSASDWLPWHVAELTVRRNALLRFKATLSDMSVQQIAAGSARALREQGVYALVDPGPDAELTLKFPDLDRAIRKAHEVGPWLGFCVLLFVLGLVCLTLAELDLGPRWLWWALIGAGSLVALAATGIVLVKDPGAAWTIAALALLLALGVVVAARCGLFVRAPGRAGHPPHPHEPGPARVPFAELAGHEGHDNWSRTIVLLIALAVFVSAVLGWRYSESLKHSGSFGLLAQRTQAKLVNQRTWLGAVTTGGVFDEALRLLNARIRCATATQLAALAADGVIGSDPRIAEDQRQRCGELKKMEERRSGLLRTLDEKDLADSAPSPAQRLRALVMDREGGPEEILALADGFAEISVRWLHRAAMVLAVLTVLAIALYLFGQAYWMGDSTAGQWLIWSGVGLLVVSVGVGTYAWVKPVIAMDATGLPDHCREGSPNPAAVEAIVTYAARKYSEGIRAYDLAATSPSGSPERTELDRAAGRAFDCAIAVRPGFIHGFLAYERLIVRADSPQRDEGYTSLASKTKLPELRKLQLRELNELADAGMLRPITRLGDFAFYSTVLGLVENDRKALDEAHAVLGTITGQAPLWRRLYVQWAKPQLWTEEERSSAPGDWFNLGLSQLATGEPAELAAAERSYDRALEPEAGASAALLAAALTDLEILKAYCPNRYGAGDQCARIGIAIDRIRPRVAAGAGADALPVRSEVSVGGFDASVTPYSVTWHARIERFDPGRDRLTVAWFRDDTVGPTEVRDPAKWQVRRALPSLIEIYRPGGPQLPSADASSGLTAHSGSYLTATSSCLSPGRYVAELFVNGALVASVPAPIDGNEMRGYQSRELDLIWCIPRRWEPWSGDRQSHPWFADKPVRGFVVGESDFAGALATFYAPPGMSDARRRDYFLRRTLQILLRKGAGGPGVTPSAWTQEKEDGLVKLAISVDVLRSVGSCHSTAAVHRPVYRFLTNASDRNLMHVGVVDGRVPAKDICGILGSLSNYF